MRRVGTDRIRATEDEAWMHLSMKTLDFGLRETKDLGQNGLDLAKDLAQGTSDAVWIYKQ